MFLWTFQTSYTCTYSHSKKYPSRVSTKYSTRTRNFIFERQVIKWKFQLWRWHLLRWLRIYITCRLIPPGGLLRIITMHFRLLNLHFLSRNISTYVAVCTILLVHIGAIKGKNTIHCHDSRVEVLTVRLLKNQVLWDETPCCQASISERFEGLYSLYPQAKYEGTTVLRNVGNHMPNNTALHTAGHESSFMNFEVERAKSNSLRLNCS